MIAFRNRGPVFDKHTCLCGDKACVKPHSFQPSGFPLTTRVCMTTYSTTVSLTICLPSALDFAPTAFSSACADLGIHTGARARLCAAEEDEVDPTDSCCSDSTRRMHCRYEVSGLSLPSGAQRCETMRADLNFRSCHDIFLIPRARICLREEAERAERQRSLSASALPLETS
jgi:hypothetical protein